jgi:hypothetical protein
MESVSVRQTLACETVAIQLNGFFTGAWRSTDSIPHTNRCFRRIGSGIVDWLVLAAAMANFEKLAR